MKIVVFGVGGAWLNIKDYIASDEHDIVAFLDNGQNKDGVIFGKKAFMVMHPSDFFEKNIAYDAIMIASTYYSEITKQLVDEYGVEAEKIVDIYHRSPLFQKMVKSFYFKEQDNRAELKRQFAAIEARQRTLLHLNAKMLIESISKKDDIKSLQEVEFKVYSQWGEDGIIQWLIHHIPIKNKTFIEFGTENYQESNTRFLLEENNWSGMIMDGSKSNMDSVKKDYIYGNYDIHPVTAFITKENINELLMRSGFDEDLGLLSIDIDGNDWWVLQEISVMRPRILICEYNALWGAKEAVTTVYKPDFYRIDEHYSGSYFGGSLEAFKLLAKEKGYSFVGVNSNAVNAFFVRNDLVDYLPKSLIDNADYVENKFAVIFGPNGGYIDMLPSERLEMLADMELVDVREQKTKKIKNIYLK